jgi:hypothetical protein
MDTKSDNKIKLFFLEKLNFEFELVPKNSSDIPVSTLTGLIGGAGIGARSTGSYNPSIPARVALRATVSEDTCKSWLEEIHTDRIGLQNAFDFFEKEEVINSYVFHSNLRVDFPENFRSRYHKCKEKILGLTDRKSISGLESIHLFVRSIANPDVIFVVFNNDFERFFRFYTKNRYDGPSYIQKLFDIAYMADAPNKKVNYDKEIANSINNVFFKREGIKDYMKTNRLKKPTLVQKSEKETLVLTGEVPVSIGLINKNVPPQFRSLYLEKTR